MPDIGLAEVSDPGSFAPETNHLLLALSKIGIVLRHEAATPQPDPGDPAHGSAAGNVKHRTIGAISMFGDLLQHQYMAGKVWLQICAKQLTEHRDIERRCFARTLDAWLERCRRSFRQPGE